MQNNIDALREHLQKKEGLRLNAYKIAKEEGEKELWHIGYGHLLEQEQTDDELAVLQLDHDDYDIHNWEGFTITKEQAEALLEVDIVDAIESLQPTFKEDDLTKLNPPRFIALLSMSFQLGGYGVQRFKAMVGAIKREDWGRAADEMLWRDGLKQENRSRWFIQTQDRCESAAFAMRNGYFEEDAPESDKAVTTGDAPILLSEASPAQLLAALAKHLGVSYNGQIRS